MFTVFFPFFPDLGRRGGFLTCFSSQHTAISHARPPALFSSPLTPISIFHLHIPSPDAPALVHLCPWTCVFFKDVWSECIFVSLERVSSPHGAPCSFPSPLYPCRLSVAPCTRARCIRLGFWQLFLKSLLY